MGFLVQDIRHAVRSLLRTPTFTAAALVTVALGIGANSTLFSIVNAVVLRPLAFPDPGRIVSVAVAPQGGAQGDAQAGHTEVAEWKAQAGTLEHLATYRFSRVTIGGGSGPERVSGARADADLFPLLGARPALGRLFRADEDVAGAPPVVVLSHALWAGHFGADSSLVGRTITMDGRAVTVLGVLPATFEFPRGARFWMPSGLNATPPGVLFFVSAIGRLRPGVGLDAARAELGAILRRGDPARPEWRRGGVVDLVTLHERLYGGATPMLLVLLGAVGFILLIACANVANLLLARAATREREFAIRASLGAGPGRLVRQVLAESVVLAVAGAAVGLLLPVWGVDLFMSAGPLRELRGLDVGVDAAVLAFTGAAALVTGVLFGLAPALAAARPRLSDALKGSAQGGGWSRRTRLRGVLVVAELASAVVLLAGAGLMLRSLLGVLAIDPGIRPDRVVVARASLPYRSDQPAAARGLFYRQLMERAAATPGVESAALADAPLGLRVEMRIAVDQAQPTEQSPSAAVNTVTDGYFATIGMRVLAGRGFTAADGPGSEPVAVVNGAFARAMLSGAEPLGRRVNMQGASRIVVGVVNDVRQLGVEAEPRPEVFVPAAQSESWPEALVLRLDGAGSGLDGVLRGIVRDLDPSLPPPTVEPMTETLDRVVAPRRVNAILLGAFAAVALLLAAVGLYGVMAYLVAQRTHEIGVRMALGAARADVLRLVIGQGGRMIAAGLVLGVGAALALTRVLASLLFGVAPTDAATFVTVPLVLAGVALLATSLPALRAARTDPMVALRNE